MKLGGCILTIDRRISIIAEAGEDKKAFDIKILDVRGLSSVADYVNTNTSYLSALFSSNLNISFNDYLNSYRIEHAKQLLDTTDMTSKAISVSTGFNSPQNFTRVFKKFEGITPGEYRK